MELFYISNLNSIKKLIKKDLNSNRIPKIPKTLKTNTCFTLNNQNKETN